jgi:hypothetical protein
VILSIIISYQGNICITQKVKQKGYSRKNLKQREKEMNKEINKNNLAVNNRREIQEAILTMDKLYWAMDEREENEKEEYFIELVQYCKQMLDEFEHIL